MYRDGKKMAMVLSANLPGYTVQYVAKRKLNISKNEQESHSL